MDSGSELSLPLDIPNPKKYIIAFPIEGNSPRALQCCYRSWLWSRLKSAERHKPHKVSYVKLCVI